MSKLKKSQIRYFEIRRSQPPYAILLLFQEFLPPSINTLIASRFLSAFTKVGHITRTPRVRLEASVAAVVPTPGHSTVIPIILFCLHNNLLSWIL